MRGPPQGPYRGPPPLTERARDEFVVFTQRAGWIIGRWDQRTGAFRDMENNLPENFRYYGRDELLFWMPQSGYMR